MTRKEIVRFAIGTVQGTITNPCQNHCWRLFGDRYKHGCAGCGPTCATGQHSRPGRLSQHRAAFADRNSVTQTITNICSSPPAIALKKTITKVWLRVNQTVLSKTGRITIRSRTGEYLITFVKHLVHTNMGIRGAGIDGKRHLTHGRTTGRLYGQVERDLTVQIPLFQVRQYQGSPTPSRPTWLNRKRRGNSIKTQNIRIAWRR